jgi:transposase-like protein
MDVGKSTMDKWVRQLRNERNGIVWQCHTLNARPAKNTRTRKKDKTY